MSDTKIPRVVIVGGGFGGLAAARALRHAPVQVVLIDKSNHYLFQPLLYQVATAILSPAEIATPLRQLVGSQKNTTVVMAEVSGIDTANRKVLVDRLDRHGEPFDYDYLILATGATHNYFGHEEFAEFAPGLKVLQNASSIRDRVLRAFEIAETEDDPHKHQDLLTFVLVGAGPTGCELSGAIAELRRYTLKKNFRRVDPSKARIVLIQSGPRILPSFHESLAAAAQRRLEKDGVEIRLDCKVTEVDAKGIKMGDEFLPARTVVWTAGVTPSPAGKWLGAPTDKAGRVVIEGDCSVPGLEGVFVVGDTGTVAADGGRGLPGVAQVAIQQGRHAGKVIAARVLNDPPLPPFKYFDKGNMAIIGRNFAILEMGKIRLSGFLAFLAWAAVHIMYLGAAGNRLGVFASWMWSYLTRQRGARVILGQGGTSPLFDPSGDGVSPSRAQG